MNKMTRFTMLPAVALSLAFAGIAQADGKRAKGPLPEDHQAKLLEQFGDEGIDGDGDGVLTRGEVHAFFGAKHGGGPHAERGGDRFACDAKGEGHRRKGPHDGKMRRWGMALHRLEMVSAENPPAKFDLTTHPEADPDGDGQVSQAEWEAFAAEKRGEILARLATRLPNADTDGDGTLSDTELEAVKDRFRARLLTKHPEADTDGDGTLSAEETQAFHAGRMEERRARILKHHPEADLDADGVLSDEEMHGFRADRHGCGGPHHEGRRGGKHGPHHPRPAED